MNNMEKEIKASIEARIDDYVASGRSRTDAVNEILEGLKMGHGVGTYFEQYAQYSDIESSFKRHESDILDLIEELDVAGRAIADAPGETGAERMGYVAVEYLIAEALFAMLEEERV